MPTTKKKKSANQPTRAAAKKAASLVDKQLARYRGMRDFHLTAEPRGDKAAEKQASLRNATEPRPFVIQKHQATRLHYDFRLGLHGVLKSWAVTKGPSYVPGDKRLAVQVEDHPMEYGGFEGTIPKGQYGGGTVMLWDEGTWEPVGDPDEGLAKGNLKFILHGKKLHGKWVLVRMGGRAAREDKPNWLLIKEHDEFERTPDDPPVLEEEPNSAVSGRTMDQITAAGDHVWQSNRPEKRAPAKEIPVNGTRENAVARPFHPGKLPGAKEKLPGFIPPQLAKQAASVPQGEEWIHELKLDGYRIQAQLRQDNSHSSVKLFSRKGLDWTYRMPAIARELSHLKVESAVLDGEVVVLNKAGQTSFADLQASLEANNPETLSYFVFDLLHLNGHNLRDQPLLERKRLLLELLETLGESGKIHFSQHIGIGGQKLFSEACRLGAEGIVSKLASAPYLSGRSSTWLKIKCVQEQEFVIGGFTLPSDRSRGIGALLLGYYEAGKLQYAGRTGTGFTHTASHTLRRQLEKLRAEKTPFTGLPQEARRGAVWVMPSVVAQVQFRTWTAENRVRQASFQGIREDKSASEVRRERPEPVPAEQGKESASNNRAHRTRRNAGSASVSKHAPVSGKIRQAAKTQIGSERAAMARNAAAPRITHPERIIDAESHLTKQALVDYFLAVGDRMLPHIAGRPLSVVRCPEGTGKECFFQKHLGQGMPEEVNGVEVPNKDGNGSETYITISSVKSLTGLAQMNVIEIHAWGSTNEHLETPDRIIFDLDPDTSVSWETLGEAAAEVRDRLRQIHLKSFLKFTGGKGLHVVAPIRPEYDWKMVKSFAHAFTLQMEKDNPQLYISKMTKSARTNKIFVDYLRNERGSTAIAPYSPRARSGIGTAVPLRWTELRSVKRPHFPVAEFSQWKSRLRQDPWKEMDKIDQRIPAEIFKSLTISSGKPELPRA